MNTRSVKRKRGDANGSAKKIDRLSQLPQPILHNILSLISQRDAVRASVLSKSWRYLWHGRLNVEFRDNWFARKTELWSFLDKTLQRYKDQNLSLHQFIVEIRSEVDLDLVLLQKWIPTVIMDMGIRSLNFICSSTILPLPLVIFQSKFLVELHLQDCNLNPLKFADNVMLNNLRTLRLHSVYITDEIFEKIISVCPLIENMGMSQCIGLKSIKFDKDHKIKDFSYCVNEQTIIEIVYPDALESVYIENCCPNWFLPHQNTQFPHLKSLNLYRVQLSAQTFDYFSYYFPCLSDLILNLCDGLKKFFLSSSSIKRLTIKTDLKNRIKAFIDTRNILYFEYSGHGFLPSIKFAPTSNKWNSQITLVYKLRRNYNDATMWFLKLNKQLKELSQSHITLNLIRSKYKKLDIDDSYGGFYEPVVVEHFKLCGCLSPSSDPAMLNCFFRIIRPSYIHMDEYAIKLAEFMCNLIPKEKGSYFWLQDLDEVSIEIWDMKAGNWKCVQRTSLPPLPSKQPIRFRLTWRKQ
ncbi:hypothetical protein CASFOL_021883 [Castilleja foliolosa]|uniref:F-box domain-containing protein n=1 Tax=Castilleja foliolosa TaxID=1961234 RepID=A0ABD3CZ69_9LAMI